MYELANEPTNKVYLDELRPYAVREPSRLKPGARVVFVHLPPLTNPWAEYNPQHAFGSLATVVEVAEKSPAELEPLAPRYPGDEKRALMILFRTEDQLSEDPQDRYASDSGVIPYENSANNYNSTNFTVLVDDLESQGLEIVLEVKPSYAEQLEKFNGEIEAGGGSLSDEFDGDYDEQDLEADHA